MAFDWDCFSSRWIEVQVMVCAVPFQFISMRFEFFNRDLSWVHSISFLDFIIHNIVYNVKDKIHKNTQ